MGACASKPKVKGANEAAPALAPVKEDRTIAVTEKKLEVPAVEVAGEVKEVADGDKVDDQSVKRRSLSHLFNEVFRNPLLLSPIRFSFSSDFKLLISP